MQPQDPAWNTPDPDAHEQTREELGRLRIVLEELTRLRSNWDGTVELVPDAPYRGAKPYACHILMDEAVAKSPDRWRTLICESLHALSAGYNPWDYQALPGWEEGVNEQLQRLLRGDALARLGIGVDPVLLIRGDEGHPFTGYINALEQLRAAVRRDEREFYLDLLGTPIRDRPAVVLEWGRALSSAEFRRFVSVFSEVNAVLKDDAIRPQ